ncbi:MAG: dienelactone hydrolase family protein [Desulfovibrionaceae bacterium]|nr:dienelactone hydrolase family protein [Desulfovibrionaceae bacterium]
MSSPIPSTAVEDAGFRGELFLPAARPLSPLPSPLSLRSAASDPDRLPSPASSVFSPAPSPESRPASLSRQARASSDHDDGRCRQVRAAAGTALVIMPSSAGVCDTRERFYARFFADRGFTCLICDALGRRGISECMTDQSVLSDLDMLSDARAAWSWLAGRGFARVGILGASKGGQCALNAALAEVPGLPPFPGRFAFHLCLCPACAVEPRRAAAAGGPVLVLCGGRDDYTGSARAFALAARLRGARVETRLLPEACHAWESLGEPRFFAAAETYAHCRFFREEDGSLTDADTGENMSPPEFARHLRARARLGAHAGGGTPELRLRGCSVMLDFLVRHGFAAAGTDLPERPGGGPHE